MRLRFWRKRRPKEIKITNFKVTDTYEPIRQININLIAHGEMIAKLGIRISELQTRIREQELELKELKKQINGKEKGSKK